MTAETLKGRNRYRNPPIDEALCEFRFLPGPEWEFTIPGNLQTELCGRYSGKSKEQRAVSVGLRVEEEKTVGLKLDEGLAKIQLPNDDGRRIVSVGPDVLSVHMLRPYQGRINSQQGGWEEFHTRISEALSAYQRVAKPKGINRIGVRYINKIRIPGTNVRIEDFLKCTQLEINGLPEYYSNFFSRVEYVYDESKRLLLSVGLQASSPEGTEWLLDLDVIWLSNTPLDCDKSMPIVDDLHEQAASAFEAILTDASRELFNAS